MYKFLKIELLLVIISIIVGVFIFEIFIRVKENSIVFGSQKRTYYARSTVEGTFCFGVDRSFIKEPEDSVISSGMNGLPILVSDPFVLKDDRGFHLFYSTVFCKKGSEYYYSWDPADFDMHNSIFSTGYAFSADKGLSWEFRSTPVILPGCFNWENRKIETPNVVKVEDKLYLFYCADGKNELRERFQVGLATLNLGEKSIYEKLMIERAMFDRDGRTDPLISKNPIGHFDMNVQEPSVIYRNNSFEIYYVGMELRKDMPINDKEDLGLIKSIGMGKAVFNRNLELISRTVKPMLTGVNMVEMKYFNDIYYLFFTTETKGEYHRNEKIAYSIYNDSEKLWSKPKVILTKGGGGSFDNWGLMAPTVIFDDKKLYLFYTAFGVQDISCFEEPITRWGIPIDNNSKCIYITLGRAVRPFSSLDVLGNIP